MVQIPLWKRIAIIGVVLLSILYAAPNMVPKDKQEQVLGSLPSWLPHKTVNLGLDLQGGSHILLQVDLKSVVKQRSEDIVSSLRSNLREKKVGYKRLAVIPEGGVRVTLREVGDADTVRKALFALDNTLTISNPQPEVIEGVFSEVAMKQVKDQVLSQSIEIVRRRIDETGTNEPVIQRQGDDRIVVQLPGLDDPQRVKDLLGKTAKLSFHLVNMDVMNSDVKTGGDMILPMQEDPGKTLAVQRQAQLTGDMLDTAAYAQDQNGQPAVSFRFNGIGTKKFCDLSKNNVNKLFAIVLDNVVISAPVIREPICGGSGQISGSFSLKEANDLSILLRAGALPAPLNIIEERTVGPSLGADSIDAGKKAALLGLILVFVLMIGAYSLFGVFSCIGMLVNLAITFAALSVLQATLTMPGIAGLVLTVCMSVDANVLIYERIREELREGRSAISAIDNGFRMAFATITDSNLTHIFAAIILFSLGSGAIKGFAVTTIIGTAASFFTSISVVRLMIVYWLGTRSKNTALPV